MNVLALCAGIGGLELGVKLAYPSARCVCYVEGEAYAASILVKRMEEKALDEAPIWSDVRTFDGKPWRGKVDCITGGYPCQPFSSAGRRLGEQDPRHLWPSIRRIVEEVQPSRCFFENVIGHLSLGFEVVASDLQTMGYRVTAGLFSAEEVGSSHGRERLFIMADSVRAERRQICSSWCGVARLDGGLQRREEVSSAFVGSGEALVWPPKPDDDWSEVRSYLQPNVCGVANGIANRTDRIRAIGNAVVPLVAAYAWRVLEDSLKVDCRQA